MHNSLSFSKRNLLKFISSRQVPFKTSNELEEKETKNSSFLDCFLLSRKTGKKTISFKKKSDKNFFFQS